MRDGEEAHSIQEALHEFYAREHRWHRERERKFRIAVRIAVIVILGATIACLCWPAIDGIFK